jgi:16S rRNA (uracil1498-N3)-methyltransferase
VHLPEILPAVPFAKALEMRAERRLLLDEHSQAPPILQVLPPERTPTDRVAVLLGPEGGWAENERKQAIDAGWQRCSLGPTILRAETAGAASLAIIQAAWSASSDFSNNGGVDRPVAHWQDSE